MKNVMIRGAVIAVVIGAALILSGSVSLFGNGNGAIIIKDVGCGLMLDPLGVPVFITTYDMVSVATHSGNTMLKCKFDVPADYWPDKAVRWTGFVCNTYLGSTYHSMAVYTPGGKAILTCLINGAD